METSGTVPGIVRVDPSSAEASREPGQSTRVQANLFLVAVAALPIHTVFFHAWISWKPWLLVVMVLVVLHLIDAVRVRAWPWHRNASIGLAVFLGTVAVSWSGSNGDRFWRLLLALCVGGAVMLVTEREMRRPGMPQRTLHVIYWSAAAMALTAVAFSLVAVGRFGAGAAQAIADLPLVDRVTKAAYLDEGFVALTNWHQDPGYAAAWMNLWAALAFMAVRRGLGSGRRVLDALVIGGLWFGVVMTLSRSGLLGLLVALVAVLWVDRHRSREVGIRLVVSSAVATVAIAGLVWILDPLGVGGDLGDEMSFRIRQGLSLGPGDGGGGPTTGGDIDYRGEVWPIYWGFFTDDPLRGAGLGTGWAEEGVQEPHNLVLELLGETGVIGLAGFIFLLGQIVRSSRSRVGSAALVVALATAITQTVLFEASWWFAAGLAIGAPQAGNPP